MHYALQRALRRKVAACDTCARSGKVPQLDASLLEISGSEYCSSFRLFLTHRGPFCQPPQGWACVRRTGVGKSREKLFSPAIHDLASAARGRLAGRSG